LRKFPKLVEKKRATNPPTEEKEDPSLVEGAGCEKFPSGSLFVAESNPFTNAKYKKYLYFAFKKYLCEKFFTKISYAQFFINDFVL